MVYEFIVHLRKKKGEKNLSGDGLHYGSKLAVFFILSRPNLLNEHNWYLIAKIRSRIGLKDTKLPL